MGSFLVIASTSATIYFPPSLRANRKHLRGNLNGIANDFKNVQLEMQGDCHDSSLFNKSLESRNDEKHEITTRILQIRSQ